jgi:hypothetical protein
VSAHLGDRLSAFLDGELPAAERAEVEGHVRECAACARELEELAAVDALARELPVQAPPGYFEALPGRLRSRMRARRRARPVALWMAAAAAAILMAVVAPATLRQAPESAMAPPATERERERSVVPEATPAAVQARPDAPMAANEAPAPLLAERRLQERDKSQKLKRAGGAPAPGAVPAAPAPARKTEDALDAGSAARYDEPVAAPARPAFAAPPAAPPATTPSTAAAAAAKRGVEGFESARVRRAEEAQTQAKDVEAQAATDLHDEKHPLQKSADAAPTPRERKAAMAGAVAGPAASALPPSPRFEDLRSRRPESVAEARALRDGWEAFARDHANDPRADEARVRAVEAGVTAWRLGRDPADLARARAAAAAYLAGEGAVQRTRVRALLETLPVPR